MNLPIEQHIVVDEETDYLSSESSNCEDVTYNTDDTSASTSAAAAVLQGQHDRKDTQSRREYQLIQWFQWLGYGPEIAREVQHLWKPASQQSASITTIDKFCEQIDLADICLDIGHMEELRPPRQMCPSVESGEWASQHVKSIAYQLKIAIAEHYRQLLLRQHARRIESQHSALRRKPLSPRSIKRP